MPTPRRPAWVLTPLACAVSAALSLGIPPAAAQTAGADSNVQADAAERAPPLLRLSPMLQEEVPPEAQAHAPTMLSGQQMRGRTDIEIVIEGNAQLRRPGMTMAADRLKYTPPDDTVRAHGNVRINREGNVYEGPALELKIDANEGWFEQPRYRFLQTQGHGSAERVDFVDAQRSVITQGNYTTCQRQDLPDWKPDWVLQADRLSIDNEDQMATAEMGQLRFKGVPVLVAPVLSFPVSDARRSGMLAPTFGMDSASGFELTLPYYWNIAPNRDATLYPMLMSKRGINLGGEFRYLEKDYQGQARFDYMPSDRLRQRNRWGWTSSHTGTLDTEWGAIGVSLGLARVSDDDYWSDFTRSGISITSRLLANDLRLSWRRGPWSLTGRALKWQTLQGTTSPITPPYDLLPQLTASYTNNNVAGELALSLQASTTRFQSDPQLTGQPNGTRSHVLGQISYPWATPGAFLTPKLQVHASHYQLGAALGYGAQSHSRVVPTVSLDSGLVFERQTQWLGRSLIQTLEPRAFYTWTPYRDQQSLPLYDTALQDFTFATIFSENAFVGNDRISDNNLLTLGLTSRLINAVSGAETARLMLAQRLRFKSQQVTLSGTSTPDQAAGASDLLLGAGINWTPQWAFNALAQYNPRTRTSERSVLSARYSPGNYRVINVAYRLQRDASEQVDVGWQWPLNDLLGRRSKDLGHGLGLGPGHLYTVGRLNYSVPEGRLVDTVAGFEYDAGCWIGRVVLERLQSSSTTASQRILFQIEFVGFTRIGSNPLATLRDNVPRYQYLRETTSAPSRFTSYE